MKGRLQKRVLGLGVLAAFAGAEAGFGAGFQLYTEGSAEAVGQGGAISARTDMISNAWYNPASVAWTPKARLMLGDTLVKLETTYEDNANFERMETSWENIPHLYAVVPFSQYVVGSLSLNVPYGLTTRWDDQWIGRTVRIETNIQTTFLTPALAVKPNDVVSFAAGLNLVQAEAYVKQWVNAGPFGTRFLELMAQDDLALGWTLAGHVKPDQVWDFGLRYQSRVHLEFEGDAKYTNELLAPPLFRDGDAETDLDLPSSVTAGVSNHYFENWVLGVDVVWTEWSTYDRLGFDFENPPAGAQPAPSEKNWKDVCSYRFGAEYRLNEAWRLRGGYVYDESPAPDNTRSPELPDNNRHMFALGCAYDAERWGVDAAYCLLFVEPSRTGVRGGVLSENGTYETYAHLISASVRVKF